MSAARLTIPLPEAPRPPPRLLAPGDMLDGRYRIESYLGGGGMASVYRATHVVLEQSVAIKVVSPQIRELPGMAQRFLREARAATHLKSEHVVRVTDVGTLPDGAPYMVMEYLEGCDLDAIIDSGDEIPIEDALDYVLQACEALAEVHGLGIVHRDLKPANLFLTRGADGLPCIKLIDFGISRIDSSLSPNDLAKLTQPETVMGSPRYMSPEQMESSGKADSRSDLYGIAVVLYELLTHRAPHEGATFLDIYAAATLAPPAAPSTLRDGVPKELDEVILRALRIDPAERHADIAELAMALAPFGPAGSMARAEAIARIHEAAQSRLRDGSASGEHPSTGEGSRVNRRASSSEHALRRRRRMVRVSLAAAVLAICTAGALALGGRALYTQGRANGIASTTATTTAPTDVAPSAQTALTEPVPATSAQLPTPAEILTAARAAAAAETTAAQPTAAQPTRVQPATLARTAEPTTATAALTAAPTAEPTAKWSPPPPRPSVTPTTPVQSAPINDERQLFEDRK